LREEIIAGKKE